MVLCVPPCPIVGQDKSVGGEAKRGREVGRNSPTHVPKNRQWATVSWVGNSLGNNRGSITKMSYMPCSGFTTGWYISLDVQPDFCLNPSIQMVDGLIARCAAHNVNLLNRQSVDKRSGEN